MSDASGSALPSWRLDPRSALRSFFAGWRPWHYALLLLVHWPLFATSRAGHNDWYMFCYPWADAVRLSIVKYHEFPWWNPWTVSGEPLFADPQIAVLMPDTIFVLAFGAVLGLKLLVVFYVIVGYEGTRFLCRELFGRSRFVEGASIIPILLPSLALHFNEGHLVFFVFYLFPWLLALALTWQRSVKRTLAFGFVIGLYLLSDLHYTIIMSFTIVGAIVIVRMLPRIRSLDTWLKAALVGCTAMAIGLLRVATALSVVKGFPRAVHDTFVLSFTEVLGTLIEPLQNRTSVSHLPGYGAWEACSYVGLCALLLAYEGFRQGDRKLRPLYLGAVICLVLAWNNRDRYFPGYWLRFAFPWDTMNVVPRWSIFASYFILLGAVHGLLGIHRRGSRARALATGLALFVVVDLGFHVTYDYQGAFVDEEPPFTASEDPPKTLGGHQENTWANIRQNLVTGGAVCPLLGMSWHQPARMRFGERGYRGEFYGSAPVEVESWSPNRIVLRGTPGDGVTLNVNPSNYWSMNGEQLFPNDRAFEIAKPFQVTVPSSGRMEFLPRPPHLRGLLALQALFALATIALTRTLKRRATKATGSE